MTFYNINIIKSMNGKIAD